LLEADAGALGVMAPGALLLPIEPLEGASDEPIEGDVEGEVVDGDVDGDLEGLIGAGVVVSSTFLPQAPRVSKADRLTATRATGFRVDAFMGFPF
jgi:hypothetical protein